MKNDIMISRAEGILTAFIHCKKLEGEVIEEMEIEANVIEVIDGTAYFKIEYFSDFEYEANYIDGQRESFWKEFVTSEAKDLFPVSDLDKAYERISQVIEEITNEFYKNTKGK